MTLHLSYGLIITLHSSCSVTITLHISCSLILTLYPSCRLIINLHASCRLIINLHASYCFMITPYPSCRLIITRLILYKLVYSPTFAVCVCVLRTCWWIVLSGITPPPLTPLYEVENWHLPHWFDAHSTMTPLKIVLYFHATILS